MAGVAGLSPHSFDIASRMIAVDLAEAVQRDFIDGQVLAFEYQRTDRAVQRGAFAHDEVFSVAVRDGFLLFRFEYLVVEGEHAVESDPH